MHLVRILLFILPFSLVFSQSGNDIPRQLESRLKSAVGVQSKYIQPTQTLAHGNNNPIGFTQTLEKENTLLKIDRNKNERRLYIYEIILIIAIVLVLALLVAFFKKKKYSRLLTQQKKEIEEQAKKLKELNRKMVELDRFKIEMGSMMVHDLKNYLNAIVYYSEEKFEDSMEIINMSARQMLTEVANILDVIKFEDSGVQLDLKPHDLAAIVAKALRQIRFLTEAKNIRVKNTLQEPLPVLADSPIILRVLINLLTNAVKYTANKGEISIDTHPMPGKRVCVLVADNGEGIPQDKLPLIFQKYQQLVVRKSGIAVSTGLGLTYCRMAVHSHGEEIGVTSKKGEGTTFWFSLKSAEAL